MATPGNKNAPVFTRLIELGASNIFNFTTDEGCTPFNRLAIAYVSGSPTVRGNIPNVQVKNAAGVIVTLDDSVLTLTAANAFVALEGTGAYQLDVTVDCSGGSVWVMGYL